MFETAELGRSLEKSEYESRIIELRASLLSAQRRLAQANFSVLMFINGAAGSGRTEVVDVLHAWLDARFLVHNAFDKPNDEELQWPEYWRYWRALPPHGKVGIFTYGYYRDYVDRRLSGKMKMSALEVAARRAVAFERALANDGVLVLKFWLHLGERQQERRLRKLDKDPDSRWRVSKADRLEHKKYAEFRRSAERLVRLTNSPNAEWKVVESNDWRYRNLVVAQHVLKRLNARLEDPHERHVQPLDPIANPKTILDQLDLSLKVKRDTYEEKLKRNQGRLGRLARKAHEQGLASVLVFEGWDAAGKGGAIRRIISALDSRHYRVIPIAAPSDEEKSQHYLWRFWRHIPRAGRVTIYDRSWYGRVLVERVEGFAGTHEWQRAYQEINDFEEMLCDQGILVIKFWLHISEKEQLRRFEERERVSYKRHKITEEDYRNREKANLYEVAVNDMIERTSTDYAPWTLVEAEDKLFARIKVLDTFCSRLKEVLS